MITLATVVPVIAVATGVQEISVPEAAVITGTPVTNQSCTCDHCGHRCTRVLLSAGVLVITVPRVVPVIAVATGVPI